MKICEWFAVASGVALGAAAVIAPAETGGSAALTDPAGLVKVQSRQFDKAYVLPGADFRGYTKVMLDPTQVAFAPNWLTDMNIHQVALMRRVTSEDAAQIAEQARAGFDDTLSDAFKRAGYEIVTTPGTDVLRLSPHLVDLYINAPAPITTAPLTRVITFNAGRAALALDVRDSTTGTLLGNAVDRRIAGNRGAIRSSARITTPPTNNFDFGGVFDTWAQGIVTTIAELKVQSPVAMTVSAHYQ